MTQTKSTSWRTSEAFEALLDAIDDWQHAEFNASMEYDHHQMDATDAMEGRMQARAFLRTALDEYLDLRDRSAQTTLARYVDEGGYCRICAGSGETAQGDTCSFCDGYGRPE